MRKQYFGFILGLSFIMLACEKEYMTYQGPEGVYFGVRDYGYINDETGPYQPSSRVEFMKMGLTTYTYEIPVLISGDVKDYDRYFKVDYDRDSTTLIEGTHFRTLQDQYLLPAGAHQTHIPVEFFTAPDLDEDEKRIDLMVIETPDFVPAFEAWDPPTDITGTTPALKFNNSRHTVFVNNMMVQPEQWLGSVQPTGQEFNALGAFTRRKMELITEELGITYSEFMNANTMTLMRMILIGEQLGKILIARYNAGDPVLEEDGRLMYAGNVPWVSYVGVPWKP